MTNEQKVKRFREITTRMADLYEKKNKNYGNSFGQLFEDLGPVAGLFPLHNKLNRATNLVKGGHNDFESLEDTFMDLANYAIMNLIEMENANGMEPVFEETETGDPDMPGPGCRAYHDDCEACPHFHYTCEKANEADDEEDTDPTADADENYVNQDKEEKVERNFTSKEELYEKEKLSYKASFALTSAIFPPQLALEAMEDQLRKNPNDVALRDAIHEIKDILNGAKKEEQPSEHKKVKSLF